MNLKFRWAPAVGYTFCSALAALVLTFHFLTPLAAHAGPRDNDSLERVAEEFWSWRVGEAPFIGDDVPRLVHPRGPRDWSAASIARRRTELSKFEARLRNLHPEGWPVHKQVDYELLESALARVRWELDVNPRWKRDPTFYIEQTLTPVLEVLAVPGPYDESRSSEIFERIRNIPSIVDAAKQNLSAPPAPFVKAAIESLADVRTQLRSMVADVQHVTTLSNSELTSAALAAADSLEGFRTWLDKLLPRCPQDFAIGRAAYAFYLHRVALLPYSPEELLAVGRQEAARARAFLEYEAKRDRGLPALPLLTSTEAWVTKESEDEAAIREFLKQKKILTVPGWVQHYRFQAIPAYVKDLSSFGEADDFTSVSRLKEDGTRYIDSPSADLDLFWESTARDPRPILIHEGFPGHYLQLTMSWTNPDPIRRYYYDSSVNEGLAFYAEEMMLQSGSFDDSPRTREIIYKFMLLRAVGIELDIRMALGEFTLEEAAAFLDKEVGVGMKMGLGGATMFASWPGVVVGYQTGKTDILRFVSDARRQQGTSFDLQTLHDFLWQNGNVPVALQRWEYLGLKDDIDRVRKF
jgi:uncharacterized protein (DUF885 family)